jgi:predicted dehydrogenase
MNEPLTVGIVGAGYWGRNLIRNFATSPDWDLRMVCDKDEALAVSRVSAMPSVGVTTRFEEILADGTIDAIAIATPVDSHYELAMAALAAGKHVLVEKPLVASVAEGERLVAFAAERGLRLMTDHTFCYTAAVRYIANMIETGELGTFHYLDSVRINLGLVQPDVDVFWDLAPHDLSILDFILPNDVEVVSVSATGADPLGIGKATLGYLSIGLSTGAIANVHVNWMSPVKVRHTIVAGSEKMIVWDDNNPSQRVSVYDAGVTIEDDAESRRRRLVGYRIGDMVAPALADLEALSLMVGEFAASIREHRDPLTSGADGLRVLRVLDAARSSLEQGGSPVSIGTPS